MHFSLLHIQWSVLRSDITAVKDNIVKFFSKSKKINENVLSRLEIKQYSSKQQVKHCAIFVIATFVDMEFLLVNHRVGSM